MANNRVEGIDDIGPSKRGQAWKVAQQFQQMKFQQQQQNNASTQDDTGNKKYAMVDRSVQTEQEINPESFDESGSIGGSFNAGSTINSSQRSDTDSSGGGSGDRKGGSYAPVKAESVNLEKLPKGKIENVSISLFGNDEFKL